MKTKLILVVGSLALTSMLVSACGKRLEPADGSVLYPDSSRVSVKRISVIQDNLAYGERRGVYLIIDKDTGKEYIGVSGIGISEVGKHSVGKHTTEDER